MRQALILIAMLTAATAAAQEFIEVETRLSDRDFYRLVACSAQPGGPCAEDIVRWPARKARALSVAITRIDPTFPARKAELIDSALTVAAAKITELDAGVRITRTTHRPNIKVLLMDHPEKSTLTGTGVTGLDGNFIDAAHVHVWWNANKRITKAVIIMTPHVGVGGIRSVMLEELVQSLGLLTDIRGSYYHRKSVFDQDSNAVTNLRGQDADAIRRHYADAQ